MKSLQVKVNALPARRRRKIEARLAELIAEPVTKGSGNVFADRELLRAEQKIGTQIDAQAIPRTGSLRHPAHWAVEHLKGHRFH